MVDNLPFVVVVDGEDEEEYDADVGEVLQRA